MADAAPLMPFADSCPLCGTATAEPAFALHDVPVFCNVLYDTSQAAAKAACGDIELTGCPGCGLIYNRCFDPSKVTYAPSYENASHFSGHFRRFAQKMADELVSRFDLHGKSVAEIGCGDAYFIRLLTDRGARFGIGYDPSMGDKAAIHAEGAPIEVRPEHFDATTFPGRVDALVCRHVLEHIDNPVTFLRHLGETLRGRDMRLYFEVPNAQWMLDALSLWDVIYEHCTYWTPPALETVFRLSGFSPLRVYTGYGGQFLMIEAQTAAAGPGNRVIRESRTSPPVSLDMFGRQCTDRLDHWGRQLSALRKEGRTVLAWGAGSKGVTFVNVVQGTEQVIPAMVDVNPRKRHKYVARCRLPVLAPEDIAQVDADTILVMNPLYVNEVRSTVAGLGLRPEIMCIHGPMERPAGLRQRQMLP